MIISPLIEAEAELTHNAKLNCPVVLSTRIRLARNISDIPFPGWAKEAQRKKILATCMESLTALPQMEGGTCLMVDELSDLEKQILMERHLISRELSKAKKGSGIVVSKDQSCSVMINEEDHLRIQYLRSGFRFKQTWTTINEIDSALEENLDYAYSSELGYLTACPTNVGTGMRASAMMHLPALVIANQMEKVIRAVNQLGIAVRGVFGEGSDASGSIFQISNQQTLGESEDEIIKRLVNVLNSVIEQENNSRHKLLEKDPIKLLDKMGRAYGLLKNSHLLSSAEAMNLLSLLRLAIDLQAIPETYRSRIDRLYIESRPGHIQYAAKTEIDPNQRDQFRSRYMREQLTELPSLNFDKVVNKS